MTPAEIKRLSDEVEKLRSAADAISRVTQQAIAQHESAAPRAGLHLQGPFRVRSVSPDGRTEWGEGAHFLFDAAVWEAFRRAAQRPLVEVLGARDVVLVSVRGDAHPMRVVVAELNDLRRRFRTLEAEHKSLLAQLGRAA